MVDERSFRGLMSCFATGVTVMTAHDPKLGPVGITINSMTSVSLKPPLVLFCLEKKAHLYPVFARATHFAVNILADTQENVSRYFADYRHHKKPEKLWAKPKKNCPLLQGTLGWAVCRKVASYKGGDHTIFLGEVLELHRRSGQSKPLLYFHSRYKRISR
ncbi:MAG: flavin reductase family protein [Alphaproteobacteria bacterium]|nr:flavin reductase family protein [Alphaproteobacteria bacterium]